jgi:predicted transglutaminase-like cysteine proteinase
MRHAVIRSLPLALLLLSLSTEFAGATGAGGLAKAYDRERSHIVPKGRALAPFAFVRFCKRNPGHCSPNSGPSEVLATAERLDQLETVNLTVNKAIRPVNDRRLGGLGDVWTVGAVQGDCEDYALTKRQRLIESGWPPPALRLAVVKTAAGEGHAVLVVRTSDGDLVLDNLTDQVKPWTRTGLRFVLIHSGEQPRRWYAL